MIKDKFLLEIITTAFYNFDTSIDVLHPDLESPFDLILSCNDKTALIRLEYKYSDSINSFYSVDWAIGAEPFSEAMKNDVKVINLTLTVEKDKLKITSISLNCTVKNILNIVECLFGLEQKKRTSSSSFEKSTLIEQFSVYTFIRDIREAAWVNAKKKIMVLRGEVDAFGYDLVLMYEKKIRYVQLKSLEGKNNPPIHINLFEKKGGCVVLQVGKQSFKKFNDVNGCDYYFVGGTPNDKLDKKFTLTYRHKKKKKKTKKRIAFKYYVSFQEQSKRKKCNYHYKIIFFEGLYRHKNDTIANFSKEKQKDKKSYKIENPDRMQILLNCLFADVSGKEPFSPTGTP